MSRLNNTSKLPLYAMLGILLTGFVLAWVLHPGHSEDDILKFITALGTKNKGRLIEPVNLNNRGIVNSDNQQWQWLGVKNNKTLWTIASVAFGNCNERCEQRIKQAQQVHKRLDKYASRVQRVILTDNIDQPAFDDKGQLSILRWGFNQYSSAFGQRAEHSFIIIDPRGSAMMVYDIDQTPADLLTDIKYLVTNSP